MAQLFSFRSHKQCQALLDFIQTGRTQLADFGRTHHIEKQDLIYGYGDPVKSLYLVKSGQVRTSTLSSEGRELVTGLHDPGDMFGQFCFCEQHHRNEQAVATEPSTVVRFGVEEIIDLAATRDGALIMLQLFCHRISALEERGFARHAPTVIMEAPVASLCDRPVPRLAAFTIWPPLAIQREIWAAGGIGRARQAVMERVQDPHISIMGRVEDRVAGTAFVARHGEIAMIHAIETDPALRRRGVAGWMMCQAANWAAAQGASRFCLAVSRDNAQALALYHRMGFREVAGYAYYQRPEGWG